MLWDCRVSVRSRVGLTGLFGSPALQDNNREKSKIWQIFV